VGAGWVRGARAACVVRDPHKSRLHGGPHADFEAL